MKPILNLLNDEKIMGDLHWEALVEWQNDRGDMGIYRSTDTPFSAESILLVINTNDKQWLETRPYRALSAVTADMETIASFADATKKGRDGQ